jgi:predicted DNA-binding transcriptional regulator AlpA
MKAKKIVNRKYIKQWLGWSDVTLWRHLKDGTIPAPISMPGCHPRWVLEDLESALYRTQNIEENTAEHEGELSVSKTKNTRVRSQSCQPYDR